MTLALLYKELALVTFDREFAASLGLPVRALEVVLTVLLVLVVVVGLQTVGVVLIVATLVTPAAAARQWTDRWRSCCCWPASSAAPPGRWAPWRAPAPRTCPPGR